MESLRLYGGIELLAEIPTADTPIEDISPPDNIILPLSDRPGVFCRSLVERGENVFKGEKIGEDPDHRMLPVYSPVSGRVTDIRSYRFAEGGETQSVFIESDGQDTWKSELTAHKDFTRAEPAEIIRLIRDAGVKLIPFDTLPRAERDGKRVTPVRHFIINGIENGFAGSIARRLLLEKTAAIFEGVRMIKHIFSPDKISLVINQKHEDVLRVLAAHHSRDEVHIIRMESYYPLGHPLLLFREITGSEIPTPGGKALDEGVVFSNVDTVVHALEAVKDGKPMIERYMSVSGLGIAEPKNLKALIGTPLTDLIEHCGGFRDAPGKIVLGNPFDGMGQFSLDRPVLKDSRLLWVQPEDDVYKGSYRACINCGDCVDICPMGLMPNFLGRFCEFAKYEEAASAHDLWTCIDCGLCAYICPSRRPLVHFINLGKRELTLKEKADADG